MYVKTSPQERILAFAKAQPLSEDGSRHGVFCLRDVRSATGYAPTNLRYALHQLVQRGLLDLVVLDDGSKPDHWWSYKIPETNETPAETP